MGEVSYCYSRSSVKFQVHAGWQITFDHVWDCKSVRSYQIPQICLVIWYSFENQIILAASQCYDTATTLYIKIKLCTHFTNPIRMELKFSRAFYEIKFDWWCTVIYIGTVDNIILSNIRLVQFNIRSYCIIYSFSRICRWKSMWTNNIIIHTTQEIIWSTLQWGCRQDWRDGNIMSRQISDTVFITTT